MPHSPSQRSTRSNSSSGNQITLLDIKTLIEASKQEVVERLERVISRQTDEITSLTRRIEELGTTNLILEEKCGHLEAQLSKLSTSIFEEFEDRHRRRKNLIFSGVPEELNGSVEHRIEADKNFIRRLMRDLSMDQRHPVDVNRIGRPGDGKSRMLRAKFRDEDDKLLLLRKARLLRSMPTYKSVFINPDRTIAQRTDRKHLMSELRARKEIGEDVVIFQGKVIPRSNPQNFL